MKRAIAAFALLLLPVMGARAQNCLYKISEKDVVVKWTAFKTPKKAPVSGTFTDIDFAQRSGKSLLEAAQGTQFSINSLRVSTGDGARDAKIQKFFFGAQKNTKITGKLGKVTKDDTEVEFTFNGVTQKLMLDNKIDGDKLVAHGVLDVLNFKMDKALAALTEACKALHEGKTWPDVEVEITANFSKTCK